MPSDFAFEGSLFGELAWAADDSESADGSEGGARGWVGVCDGSGEGGGDGGGGEGVSDSHGSRPCGYSQDLGSIWDGRGVRMEGDLVVVYTDGACRLNQDARFRRAGVGVFWSHGHRNNISQPLVG